MAHLPECECPVCKPLALVCYLDDWRPWHVKRQAKRRQPLPPRPPAAPAAAPEDEVLELRVEVAELRKQVERLIREVARKDGERNPLPASWGGETPTLDELRALLALAEAEDRAEASGEGAA